MVDVVAAESIRGARPDAVPVHGSCRGGGSGPFRALGAAQTVWGVTLLTAGPQIWSRLAPRAPSDTDRLAMTVLGGRHVATGLAQVVLPRHFQRLGICIDLLHLSSMCVLAVIDPPRRRPAVVTGATALTTAVTAWSIRRRSSAPTP